MIQIVIADDELVFREYMEQVIDWETIGAKVVGICKNGEQVINCVKENRVNIALLDINMPGMDGILLAEKLLQEQPTMKIVFITGYSEFEYARKAMSLGITDYILKPFNKEELRDVVMKKIRIISKENSAYRKQKFYEHGEKEKLFLQLMSYRQEIRYKEIVGELENFGINLANQECVVAVMEYKRFIPQEREEDQMDAYSYAIANICEEIISEYPVDCEINQDKFGHLLIYIYHHKMDYEMICTVMEKIQKILEDHLKINNVLSVSDIGNAGFDSYRLYNHALLMMERAFTDKEKKLFYYKETEKQQNITFYNLTMQGELLKALRCGETEKINEVINAYSSVDYYDRDTVILVVDSMIATCLAYIAEMNEKNLNVLGSEFQEERKKAYNSAEECFEFIRVIYEKTADYFKEKSSPRIFEIVEKAKKYIDENYWDYELRVTKVAEAVFLDASYVRKAFFKVYQKNISEYITEVRMVKAGELMQRHPYSVAELSEKVGYQDSAYFTKCFRKYYGITPSEYGKKKHPDFS